MIAAIALVVAAVVWLRGGVEQRTVGDLLESDSEIHPVEATSELCREPGCVEGWRTDVGDYLRFDSVGEAEYWAAVRGDESRRWENFVLDFGDNELNADQRRLAVDILFAWHDWN
ncbi:hypothetical protein [Brevibacterium gallinarum]|uniref:Uncharacterized protein n=1 Tax=Brevibacterium gallinarum TaxID=2762220 RepID=A0ABR8WR53_9MICO|nr:hypothetical protein [Brevibacterium gallinarum]MBD8019555.1 hypothetical protein [Brevibacterium gallinarum]